MTDQDSPSSNSDEDDIEYVSKSQLKREMLALQELGERLTTFNEEQLAALPLDDKLLAAIRETKNIRKREALRRHFQYIGKLMRAANTEDIVDAVAKLDEQHQRITRLLHVMEKWRDDLIGGGSAEMEAFIEAFPAVDRQELRHLIRGAQQDKRRNKPPTNARKLFRLIRDLMSEQSSDS